MTTTPASRNATIAADVSPRSVRSQFASHAVAFAIVAAVIVARDPSSLFHAEFFGEDGMNFLPDALHLGAMSLLKPHVGMAMLLGRFGAWLATAFPVRFAPTLYAAYCLAISATAFSWFSRDGYAWLIASRPARVAVCVLLAIAPGTPEALWHLSDLHYVAALWFGIALLDKPTRPGFSLPLYLLLVVLAASAAKSICYLPLVVIAAVRWRDTALWAALLVLVGIAVWNTTGTTAFAQAEAMYDRNAISRMPLLFVQNFAARGFIAPIAGASLTLRCIVSPFAWFASSVLAIAAATFASRRAGASTTLVAMLGALVIGGVLSSVLNAVLRTTSIFAIDPRYSFGGVGIAGQLWTRRYAFMPGADAMLAWCVLLENAARRSERPARALFSTLLCLIAAHELSYWPSHQPHHATDWPVQAARIQRAWDMSRAGTLNNPVGVEYTVQMWEQPRRGEWIRF